MFIVEGANSTTTYNDMIVPEITDFSDDTYNIMEGSMFFEEGISKIVRATALAEVCAFKEGTLDSFEESVGGKVKEKLQELWAKFKAFVVKVKDRFIAWLRKTFTSNASFLVKYKKEIKENLYKLEKKNPDFEVPDFETAAAKFNSLMDYSVRGKIKAESIEESRNTASEEIAEIVKSVNEALDDTKTVKVGTAKVFATLENVTDFLKDTGKVKTVEVSFEKSTKSALDDAEKDIKTVEKLKDNKDYAVSIATLKLKKEKLSKQLDLAIKIDKKSLAVITKMAYAVLKLQHVDGDSIKKESAIDTLTKYLERI